ncbi:MAG: hypothetical protein ACFFDT_05995 [Candidatus Hodarchaeota archaeon]
MSIINMETGSSNVTAAKAFFAITVAIILYEHNLSTYNKNGFPSFVTH